MTYDDLREALLRFFDDVENPLYLVSAEDKEKLVDIIWKD